MDCVACPAQADSACGLKARRVEIEDQSNSNSGTGDTVAKWQKLRGPFKLPIARTLVLGQFITPFFCRWSMRSFAFFGLICNFSRWQRTAVFMNRMTKLNLF